MRGSTRICGALLLLAVASAGLAAKDARIELRAEPREATVGDSIAVTVVVEAAGDASLEPPSIGPELGELNVSSGAWGAPTITDKDGIAHHWRRELCEQLLSRQARDGSWVNEADRWYEGNPHLVTAYAVLALQEALGDCK